MTSHPRSRGPASGEPFFCHDCQRRFFNLGWHAEACGSPNYERMDVFRCQVDESAGLKDED